MHNPAVNGLPSTRDLAVQALLLAVIVGAVIVAVTSARTNLDALGLTSGFDFLDRATGWSYSFGLVERSIDDPYRWTLFVGFLNSLFLGVLSIVFATVLGFAVGAGLDARNIGIRAASTVFVQIFRNIPLILQLVFWYAVLIHLPGPRQAMNFADVAFASSRGFYVTWFNFGDSGGLVWVAWLVVTGAFALFFSHRRAVAKVALWLLGAAVAGLVIAVATAPEGEGVFTQPALKGLRFRGGLELPVEFVAMLVAIVLYGAAYIAEVVKGGLRNVPRGLIEASGALGLSASTTWFKVKLPVAMRSIVPPLGNQWIFLMKATTIGVAIGFSDLFMIVSTSITQSGQTLELIAILMGAFLALNFSLAQFVNLLNARVQFASNDRL